MYALLLLVTLLSCSTTSAFHPLRPAGLRRHRPLLSTFDEKISVQSQTSTFDRPAIFVGSIPLSLTKDQLEDVLKSRLGDRFQSCFLVHDKVSGNSRGFAYVNVNDDSNIEEALSQLRGTEVLGRALKVDLKISKKLQSRASVVEREAQEPRRAPKKAEFSQQKTKPDFSEVNARSIFVGNLDTAWSKEEFRCVIEENLGPQFDSIQCRLAFLPTGANKGFGHVEFPSAELAQSAVNQLNGLHVHGRSLTVNMAGSGKSQRSIDKASRSESKPENTVFVGNLSWEVTNDVMADMLTDVVGPNSFVSIRVAFDKVTKKPRGFAHVEFVDLQTAERAIRELNALEVMGRALRADMAGNTARATDL